MACIATKEITEENTWTEWLSPKPELSLGQAGAGTLNLSIWGTWKGTVTLQRSFDAGVTPLDVDTYKANEEAQLIDPEVGVTYRIGIATGDYKSGTCCVRIGY